MNTPSIKNLDNESPILEEIIPGSKRIYFIFGGFFAGMGMMPFEFFKSSQILKENKIFFRDFSQAWYQNGLPGIGRDIYEVRDYINQKIAQLNASEVFFVGNSMGGYAAILFSTLVGSGQAIAFAPQTFISPLKRLKYRDNRWAPQVLKAYRSSIFKKHHWDLQPLLAKRTDLSTIHIFVSRKNRLDFIHANQLRCIDNVTIHEYDVGGHALVKYLRDAGKLPDILNCKMPNNLS